jgi:hypothetical protein
MIRAPRSRSARRDPDLRAAIPICAPRSRSARRDPDLPAVMNAPRAASRS